MKFVYLGYDFMLDCAAQLRHGGHELAAIFTFECDNVMNLNVQTHALAKDLNIPITEAPITADDIETLCEDGVTCFLSAGYLHKIPSIDEAKAYGINIHPALLPKGRGVLPVPSIIMTHPDAGGVTIHKLTEQMDSGDIIAQKPVKVSAQETVETYSARAAMEAVRLLHMMGGDIKSYWDNAVPQNEDDAIMFDAPDAVMRLLDWSQNCESLSKKARAFGRYGCIAVMQDTQYIVYDCDIWQELHDFEVGTCVFARNNMIVIAVKDGFFLIKDGEELTF